MFDHVCTSCQKRQLIFPSQIASIANTESGIEVSFTCWCGAVQTWLTGAATEAGRKVGLAA
jgi:hypothetical protein